MYNVPLHFLPGWMGDWFQLKVEQSLLSFDSEMLANGSVCSALLRYALIHPLLYTRPFDPRISLHSARSILPLHVVLPRGVLLTPSPVVCTYRRGRRLTRDLVGIRRSLGVCFQQNTLFEQLTVTQHLELFAVVKGVRSKDVKDEAARMVIYAPSRLSHRPIAVEVSRGFSCTKAIEPVIVHWFTIFLFSRMFLVWVLAAVSAFVASTRLRDAK